LVGVLKVMRCVILARVSSNQRSSVRALGRAWGATSDKSAKRGDMGSQSVYFQFRPLDRGFRSGVERKIVRAV